mgnify:CR=1 FL=1
MKRKVQESLQSDELLDREGDFYTRAAGWDYYRLPLIDPFEASNTTGDLWLISNDLLSSKEGNSGPCGIKSINVDKPYIFVYCEAKDKKDEFGPVLRGQAVLKAWFVINVDTPDIYGFNNEEDYINYLSQRHISRHSLLSERYSQSILAFCAMVFMEVPPEISPTLYVVLLFSI